MLAVNVLFIGILEFKPIVNIPVVVSTVLVKGAAKVDCVSIDVFISVVV